ncbi:MAG: citrate:proton symporter [Youngiibacter sp.]|nr:citrate:proton symporter [Youngiibacter sp.]
MLAFLGLATVLLLLVLVMTKKATPVVALIAVPTFTALIAGSGLKVGTFITNGIKTIAPTGVMFIFAILFFGILSDAGTFNPIINKILKVVGKNPAKITVGTAILAMIVHLDGSGAVTFLVTTPAMLPLYDALGMKRSVLATVTALAAGTMNIVPWGGPTLRAATALNIEITKLFNPVLVPMLFGIAFVLFAAYYLGNKEKARLGNLDTDDTSVHEVTVDAEKEKLLRPRLFVFNILLIIAAIAVMISAKLPPQVVFMFAFCIALIVNYPKVADQRSRVDAHAKEALMMASVLFAAGAFTGIMKDSGMITAMSEFMVAMIPQSLGKLIPLVTGIVAMPLSLIFDPDSYYFGVMPVIANAAAQFGVDPVMVGRASILGQMTTGFPVSPLTAATFLLTGLTGVDLGEHQKNTIPWAFAATIIMLVVALVMGVVAI